MVPVTAPCLGSPNTKPRLKWGFFLAAIVLRADEAARGVRTTLHDDTLPNANLITSTQVGRFPAAGPRAWSTSLPPLKRKRSEKKSQGRVERRFSCGRRRPRMEPRPDG